MYCFSEGLVLLSEKKIPFNIFALYCKKYIKCHCYCIYILYADCFMLYVFL